MTDNSGVYVPQNPGDMITAEAWNGMQAAVKADIAAQIAAAVGGIKTVPHANDSDELGGKTLDDLIKDILAQVFTELPKHTGHRQLFCNLSLGADRVIQHGLKSYPLADIYQLDYFQVVCAKNDTPEDAVVQWALFYLYHGDERRLRVPGNNTMVDIESTPRFRLSWKSVIDSLVNQGLLHYTDDTTLDELETDFWQALFAGPNNDTFDPDAYCHSPWFEKCCGENRTVGELKRRGDFDNLFLKLMPQKTVNYPFGPTTNPADPTPPLEASNVRVSQLDLDTLALRLLAKPDYADELQKPADKVLPLPGDFVSHLPVMVLLKV